MLEESLDAFLGDLEGFLQDIGKVKAVESCLEIILWIHEPDVFQLNDRIGDFLGPVPPAGLDHSEWKAMEGYVEYMPPRPLEPCGETSELVVMLEKKNRMTLLGQAIGSRKSVQPTSITTTS